MQYIPENNTRGRWLDVARPVSPPVFSLVMVNIANQDLYRFRKSDQNDDAIVIWINGTGLCNNITIASLCNIATGYYRKQ